MLSSNIIWNIWNRYCSNRPFERIIKKRRFLNFAHVIVRSCYRRDDNIICSLVSYIFFVFLMIFLLTKPNLTSNITQNIRKKQTAAHIACYLNRTSRQRASISQKNAYQGDQEIFELLTHFCILVKWFTLLILPLIEILWSRKDTGCACSIYLSRWGCQTTFSKW